MTRSIMADGTIDSQNFVLGKSLSSISNFPQDVFGTTAWGYKLTAIRWNGSGYYGLNWSPMIAVATSDTHGYITISYLDASTCYIGGGGGTAINWQAKLFNDSMNLIPKNNTYSIGSASVRWYEIYASRFIANGFLQVGNGRIYYDSSNNALYVQKSDGTQCGFYATGFVSAKGGNSSSGSAVAGVTELSKLDDVAISSPVNGQALVYRNGVWRNETISGGGSSSVAWADVTGKPTWIPDTDGSGSGIDADLLDGTHKSGLFTAMTYAGSTLSLTIGGVKKSVNIETSAVVPTVTVSSTSSRNLSVNVGGSTDYVNDLYATYLDGTTKAGLFTGLTYSSNRLSVTIGGTTKSVTISGGSSTIPDTLALERLDIEGTANSSAYISANYPNNMYINVGGANLMTFDGDGTVVTPGAAVAGVEDFGSSRYRRWRTIYSVNSLNTSSDLRLKDVRAAIPLTVAQVAAAPSFLYRWKKGADTALHAGSSAQYWRQALPQAVAEGADGYLAMEYDRIALAAASATARAVETLDQRVARLEKENARLRRRLRQHKINV